METEQLARLIDLRWVTAIHHGYTIDGNAYFAAIAKFDEPSGNMVIMGLSDLGRAMLEKIVPPEEAAAARLASKGEAAWWSIHQNSPLSQSSAPFWT